MFDLHGRVAVVTGASSGLGRQFALALARQGADLVILARRMEKLEEVAEEIRAVGSKCLPVKCDVSKAEDIKAAVKATIDEYGKVDILVNNAGGGPFYPIFETPDEFWQGGLDVELTAVFRATRDFGAEMAKQGYGRIINISSLFGKIGTKELQISNYCAVKGAVINLTRECAGELAPFGITVNCICPGFFPSGSNTPEAMAAMAPMINAHTFLGRAGVEGELDTTIVYLAADESSYVTGAIISADGGWTAG